MTTTELEQVAARVVGLPVERLYEHKRRNNTVAVTMLAGFRYYYNHDRIADLAKESPRDHSSLSIAVQRFNTWLVQDREFRLTFDKFLDELHDPTVKDYFAVKNMRTIKQTFVDRVRNMGLLCEEHRVADFYVPTKKLLIFVSHGQWLQVAHTGETSNYYADLLLRANTSQVQGYKTLIVLPEDLFTLRTMEMIERL